MLLLDVPTTHVSGWTPELLWAAVTAVGTFVLAAIGFVTYYSTQARNQRALIDRQVQTEVKAAIGGSLLDFVNFRETVQRDVQSANADLERLRTTYELDLKKVHQEASNAFNELMELHAQLKGWAGQVELIAAVPGVLVRNARDEARDHPDAASLSLLRLLEHPTADSDELDEGGDVARIQLQDRALAMKLYERAVAVNPDNVTAKADLLELRARLYNARRDAIEELIRLVRANPSNADVFSALVNSAGDGYEPLKSLLLELLSEVKYKSLVWGRLAMIYRDSGESTEKVTEAFETSMKLAQQEEGKVRFVNVARPYVRYLLRQKNLPEAFRIVNRMIEYLPLEAELHIIRGDIYRATGDLFHARCAYELAQRLGFGQAEALATEMIAEISVLEELAKSAAPQFPAEPIAVSENAVAAEQGPATN